MTTISEQQSLRGEISQILSTHFATAGSKSIRGVTHHVCTCGQPYRGKIREHLVDVIHAAVQGHL